MSGEQGGWGASGFGYAHQCAVTNARKLFAVGLDATNEPRSTWIPNDGAIQSIEISADTIGGGGTSFTVTLWRDAAGDRVLLTSTTANITASTTTAAMGGALVLLAQPLPIHRNAHSVDGSSGKNVRLYIGLALNAGTCNANVKVNYASQNGVEED